MSKNTEAGKGSVVIYRAKGGKAELEVKLEKETVWLTQHQMARLVRKTVPTINEHIKNVFKEGELEECSTIRKFRIVQNEGGRKTILSLERVNENSVCAIFAHTSSDLK